jgi:hypothetical protein
MSDSIWQCRFCEQENLAHQNLCEACGETRGSAPPQNKAAERRVPRLEPQEAEAEPEPGGRRFSFEGAKKEVKKTRKNVKMRFLSLADRLKGAFTRETYREVLKDRSNPATSMLIAFLVWGIFRMVGFVPLMIILRALAFLMGPFGLVLTLALAYVYSQHQAEIDERVGAMRRRARLFKNVTMEAARSIGWLRGRIQTMGRPGPDMGEPAPGASARILDDDAWEDDDTPDHDINGDWPTRPSPGRK